MLERLEKHPQIINPNEIQIQKLIEYTSFCIDGSASDIILVNKNNLLKKHF